VRAVVRAALAAALAALALPGAAGALDLAAFGPSHSPQSKLIRSSVIPVKLQGSAQVQFAGSQMTGCGRPCGVSGRVTWDPTGEGELAVAEYQTRKGRQLEGSLFFFGGLGATGPTTTAHVSRRAADGSSGVCSDARSGDLVFLDFSADSPTHLETRLVTGTPDDSDLFRTRCGGPLERDLVAALPSATLTRAQLLKGGTTVDLSATRPFAAHGYTGTVTSSITLRLGQAGFAPGIRDRMIAPGRSANSVRTVRAVYAIEQVSGGVATAFRGGDEPSLCEPLDVCGASGTLRLEPRVSSGRATLVASGPARRTSGRQLRAALGLRPGRRVRGISALGSADWTRDAGGATESFTDGDGSVCNDTAPLGAGYVTLTAGRRRIFASYGRAPGAGLDPFRTRCPGPAILDAAASHALATGDVPRSAFRKRRVAITLDRGRPFESEPYFGETRASLTIVLRRVRVRETVHDNAETDTLGVL
jgi:hypothetical protein